MSGKHSADEGLCTCSAYPVAHESGWHGEAPEA